MGPLGARAIPKRCARCRDIESEDPGNAWMPVRAERVIAYHEPRRILGRVELGRVVVLVELVVEDGLPLLLAAGKNPAEPHQGGNQGLAGKVVCPNGKGRNSTAQHAHGCRIPARLEASKQHKRGVYSFRTSAIHSPGSPSICQIICFEKGWVTCYYTTWGFASEGGELHRKIPCQERGGGQQSRHLFLEGQGR